MSNGKSGDDARSMNDAYLQPAINYRFDSGSTLTFAPKIRAYFAVEDENPDYADYAGYVDWNLRWAQDNGAVVSAMYRQGASRHRTTQLDFARSEEHTSELQSLMRISYAVFCLKKKKHVIRTHI